MSELRLNAEEEALLAGAGGPALRQAMEIVVALGRIYGAPDLVPVKSVQVAGVSYKNLGAAGLEFLNAWADEGARAVVPAMLNPAGMDLSRWRELGIPADFARAQQAVVDAFARMGIGLTLTCTPYLVGQRPAAGDHLAWSESSAVSFANSVLGARSNREGGPSALAAAFTGKTARYGLHLDEHRRPTHVIEVCCPVRSEADLGALGALVGKQVGAGVPFLRGLDLSWSTRPEDCLKSLGAAMAASGAVALYHIAGHTPEAAWAEGEMRAGPPAALIIDDLRPGYAMLNGPLEEIDFVSLGCPHASLDELRAIAGWLAGRRVKALLWITVAGAIRAEAERRGLAAQIEAAGGHLVADTCLVVAPVQALGVHSLATNSAKAALYAAGHSGLQTRFGTMKQCLQAAVSGVWPGGTA